MIVVAYGANLDSRYGDPVQTFDIARQMLGDYNIQIIKSSSLYDTSPVGTDESQPWYTNAVMAIQTDLPPHDLLKTLLEIEAEIGRTRDKRNEPRAIDLDLIAYNDQVIKTDNLTLPHPRMHERKFVLHPLHDIAPDWYHPAMKQDIKTLMNDLPADQKIRKIQ